MSTDASRPAGRLDHRWLASILRVDGRKFAQDARGAVAVLVALAAVPLIGTIGIGVDTGRGYIAKSRLAAAVGRLGARRRQRLLRRDET